MEEKRNRRSGNNDCNNDQYKENCTDNLSSELKVPCNNICNSKCVGILAEKIYDCVYLKSLEFADKDEVFVIDSCCGGRYCPGDSICIDEVSLCYDYIGIKSDDELGEKPCIGEGNVRVRYDMQDIVFYGEDASSHIVECRRRRDDRNNDYNDDALYTELTGVVPRQSCNAECCGRPEKKVRVFKQGVRFFVDNLVVRIKGRIGNQPFTAAKYYNDNKCFHNPCDQDDNDDVLEITKKDCCRCGCPCDNTAGLNFTPINLYGSVGVPSNANTVNSSIKFSTCLSADCVETNERYGESGEGRITATVGYSFLVNSSIRHTTSEELAVFVNPKGVKCRNTGRTSDCVNGCNEI